MIRYSYTVQLTGESIYVQIFLCSYLSFSSYTIKTFDTCSFIKSPSVPVHCCLQNNPCLSFFSDILFLVHDQSLLLIL